MTRAELGELREAWARGVLLGPHGVALPCWFSPGAQEVTTRIDAGPCEGRIQGAHWIKRRTVERWVKELYSQIERDGETFIPNSQWREEMAHLAAWDARNGVPACERHHPIFDSQRVPLPSEQIVVWRHQVPAHVEAFALDWGLEHELDRKHSTIGGGI